MRSSTCTCGEYDRGYHNGYMAGRRRAVERLLYWPGPTVPASDVAAVRALLAEGRPFSIDTGSAE